MKMLIFTMVLAATASAGVAQAQPFPNRPIKLVVPYSPGGSADITARIVADGLTARYGHQIVVENRPGAAGNIGTQAVAQAKPDGYTLLLGYDGTLAINPWVYAKAGFDPVKDFAPVTKVVDSTLLLVASNSLTANTLKDLIALAKSAPGTLSYGTSGIGSVPHLATELLNEKFGIDLIHVPYSGGSAAMPALMGNHIQLVYTAVGTAGTFVKTGKVKALGVSSARRSAALPEVPTFSEAGVPGFELTSWFGILAPAKTPAAIVEQLRNEIKAVIDMPAIHEKLVALGLDPVGGTPAEFATQLRNDFARWEPVVKRAKIRVD
jgi:tripartite-type tricarboxylate transporter receptor subunit TctC